MVSGGSRRENRYGGKRMKALTIWQPWAGAAAAGIKHNETRSWYTNYRGPLAIHAAKQSIQTGWARYTGDEAAEVI